MAVPFRTDFALPSATIQICPGLFVAAAGRRRSYGQGGGGCFGRRSWLAGEFHGDQGAQADEEEGADGPDAGVGGVGQEAGIAEEEVRAAFARLYAKRVLVIEPGDPTRIRMAPPFSGIPTGFPVQVRGKNYYANCVWDAFGIPAALHADAVISAEDGFTGAPLTLEIRDGRPLPQPYVGHFAVPAARWWEDIVFT